MHELMGTADIIKEEILKMAKMNQCSHCQESPIDGARLMDETSVLQPVYGFPGKKDW